MRIVLLSWLFLPSLFQIFPGFVCGQCRSDQKWLLLQLKINLNSTTSTTLKSWNNSQDCCIWDGVVCDSSGHVVGLDLNTTGINGGIETVLRLQYLESLNLANNNFIPAQIPRGLANLTNLRYLNLSNAGFIGQIPIELTKLSRLVTLDLSTQFPFPLEQLKLENPNLRTFVENLTQLTHLYVDGVNISAQGSDWCSALSALSNLTALSLKNCHLSGPIHSSLSRLLSLSVIRLDSNNLSTTVPEFITSFSNLTVLSLGSCHLQGQFPDKIFQVPTLQNLDLSHNNLTGSLPESIGSLRSLSKIDLSSCNFSGQLPSTLTNLKVLVYLDFSFNKFNGSIPTFQMSKKLQYVDLSHNHLTGSISSTHFEGDKTTHINLGYNSLSGSIPSSLFALPALKRLILTYNQFDQLSEFPSAFASPLNTLDLSNNRLKGPIPKSFFGFLKLSVLLLSFNQYNGTIELGMIKGLHNLTTLDLSYNNLSISTSNPMPSTFPQLGALKLASCNLKEFPDLKNQTRLIDLDLSNNQIKGEIPNWIWNVGKGSLETLNLSCNLLVDMEKPYGRALNLGLLDLHSNKLQGEFQIPTKVATYVDYSSNNFNNSIPPDIGNYISFAYFFSLSNNGLNGEIPESICNATYLQVLDLSNNVLTGNIPECLFENMEDLGVLNLGTNNLNGSIPNKFPLNCGLKTLDLSRNRMGGQLPGSLVNCSLLEVLNVGNNILEDTFPCMLKNISSLRVLILRSNSFHGELDCPEANQRWSNLQIIDIAANNFTGKLSPWCFSNWDGMKTEDESGQAKENRIRFLYLTLSRLYYQDTVTVTTKGLELELVKILTIFTSIDFSGNNFEGSIPDTIGNLKALYVLNLSHNGFTSAIPRTLGNLKQLESLDLSKNSLSGAIPGELANLTYLSFLNLSFNNLSGSIPTGPQLQTFTKTSFEGNAGLCGFQLNTSCNHDPSLLPPSENGNSEIQDEFDWQVIFTGVGFGTGAAIILAPLIVSKEGREKCNEHLEKVIRMIFPTYGFSYTRYDERKVEVVQKFEDDFSEDTEDSEEEQSEPKDEGFHGRYCVYCSRLDIHRKKAVHCPKCICHTSPFFVNSPTSSSAALLAIYHHHF